MPSLDHRTKRRCDVRPVTIADLVDVVGPELAARHGTEATRAQHALGLPPLALAVGDEVATIEAGSIRAGDDRGGLRAELEPDALTDLMAGVRSLQSFAVLGGAELTRGRHRDLLAWDYALRALRDGVPLHQAGAVTFDDRDGAPLDLGQTFTPDDEDLDIAHFLATAGFLHLRGWIDPAELAQVEREVRDAAATTPRDAPHRWWATMVDGTERCVRVMYVLDVSPTMAALVESDAYERLARLFRDGHRRFPERAQSSEALIKPADVAEGVTEVPWHRDCTLGGHDYSCAGYAVGLPLGPTGAEAGQLRVVAGSHRASTPAPGAIQGFEVDLPVVRLATEPGDLTVHVSCTFHSTTPPVTRERTVVYTTFSLPPLPGDDPRERDGVMLDLERVRAPRG